MSSFISLADAQTRLTEVVENMIPGEKLFITINDYPIAELVRTAYLPTTEPRKPGSAIGKILYMADDFDAPLEDFKEYME
jgi:antitoxin (DNA-binding transcriptional repressor) of toxin-antitoxin stability system